jgi:thiamine biosynthesis lipoprotein
MSSTQQIFRPIQIIFRLSPLMAALTVLMSPFTATQADELSINIKDAHQLSAPIQLPSYRFHQDHVLGTSLDVVVTTSQQQDAEKALQAIQTEMRGLIRFFLFGVMIVKSAN